MRRLRLASALPILVLLGVGCTGPSETKPEAEDETAAVARQVPANVLILGDSISMGYYPYVGPNLTDLVTVHRPSGNHRSTWEALTNLDRWLGGRKWDVIHFNFGLHDLKRVDAETGKNSNDPNDPHQAPPDRYRDQLRQILKTLEATGHPTGVMLQIGTRNAQNFELLKAVGQQTELPVLFKRGMGITLEESLNACEYVASGGNRRIVFCLRGMKTNLGDPHRNFVDFAHVPVIKRLTRLPVCIDPSHSVGSRAIAPDGLLDVFHVTAQGIIAGANMVLVDFHPNPSEALCDGPQALLMDELPRFIEDAQIVRDAYLTRLKRIAIPPN